MYVHVHDFDLLRYERRTFYDHPLTAPAQIVIFNGTCILSGGCKINKSPFINNAVHLSVLMINHTSSNYFIYEMTQIEDFSGII